MSDDRSVGELWAEVKLTVESLERDLARNVDKHNVSAGVRVRKGVRKLRELGAELIRSTTKLDKSLTETRRSEKRAKKTTEPTTDEATPEVTTETTAEPTTV